jgi:hypothetical protein
MNLDGYYYREVNVLSNYNETIGNGSNMILASHPIGSNTIEPRFQDKNQTYTYYYDGEKSNNILVLIDDVDPAYASYTGDIHIAHDMNAWVYAPNNNVIIDNGVTLRGGVIANKVTITPTATIIGVTPNEGFVNVLNSKYIDISWEVVYE